MIATSKELELVMYLRCTCQNHPSTQEITQFATGWTGGPSTLKSVQNNSDSIVIITWVVPSPLTASIGIMIPTEC